MFDPSSARVRVERLWKLRSEFGTEHGANRVLLDEIVSDRLQLVSGMQVLRDELQFTHDIHRVDREAARADLTLPSVVTTLAYTNCGDRIHQGEIDHYMQVVGSRFATLSEVGVLKCEVFRPTGGGTDDGATLAHVTWAHVLDEPLRERIYAGNAQSYVACGFDLNTHLGRLDSVDGSVVFGRTQESPWREPRGACGAIVGALAKYDPGNGVHRRVRKNLGDENFEFLTTTGVHTADGVDVSGAVAAAVVSIQGALDTAGALAHEMDERGVAHVTASMVINRSAMADTMMYLSRATVFAGEIVTQGLGTDATKYSARLVDYKGDRRLHLAYEGRAPADLPIRRERYGVLTAGVPRDIFA